MWLLMHFSCVHVSLDNKEIRQEEMEEGETGEVYNFTEVLQKEQKKQRD